MALSLLGLVGQCLLLFCRTQLCWTQLYTHHKHGVEMTDSSYTTNVMWRCLTKLAQNETEESRFAQFLKICIDGFLLITAGSQLLADGHSRERIVEIVTQTHFIGCVQNRSQYLPQGIRKYKKMAHGHR